MCGWGIRMEIGLGYGSSKRRLRIVADDLGGLINQSDKKAEYESFMQKQ
jgi:hypothetical protein